MHYLIRSPRFWLLSQMMAVVVLAGASGRLTVKQRKDSLSYIEASREPLAGMLDDFCTVGYPLILKAVAPISPDFRLIPWVQLASYLLAVLVFDAACRRFGASPAEACAAATGVLWTVFYDTGVDYLLTDCLGRAAAVATISLLVWVAACPKRLFPWLGLTLSLAATYHVRPAYLFLIGLVPCLGLVLLRIHTAWKEAPFRWFRLTSVLCGISILPYLAFCFFRLIAVGHFGLVSFGGANVVGITVELIDERTIETRLPEPWRPLAWQLVRQRQRLGLKSSLRGRAVDVRQWVLNYSTNVWDVAYPAAARMYGDDPVTVNQKLNGISRAVIWSDPKGYFRFVVYNLRYGLGRFLQCGGMLQAFASAALLAFFLRVMIQPKPPGGESAPNGHSRAKITHALLLTSLAFAAGKWLLVGFVEVYVPRYVFAAGVFLPAFLSLMILHEAQRIWGAIRAREDLPASDG